MNADPGVSNNLLKQNKRTDKVELDIVKILLNVVRLGKNLVPRIICFILRSFSNAEVSHIIQLDLKNPKPSTVFQILNFRL